ncbi:MAG: ribonuclease Z [Lachnospirales bacterium]
MVEVSLLGTGGMLPLQNRYLTAMALRYKGKVILVDCGEGTQVALRNTTFGYKKIDYICFTHFHADHVTGLPGLLLTIGNSDRVEPIYIIGPRGIGEIVRNITVVSRDIPFNLEFIEVGNEDFSLPIFENELVINCKNMHHGKNIQCLGYRFDIKRVGKFNVDKAKQNNVPQEIWGKLQKNDEVIFESVIYRKEQVLDKERKGISVSYCTDTRPFDEMAEFVYNSDLFICEGLYGDDEKFEIAKKHNHMIFREACEVALNGEVKELWLTHYSPAFTEPLKYDDFIKSIFPKAYIGEDGKSISIQFEE